MKRILINATHGEEVRVALCKGNHLYDFDLENRTREQKKANIYKGHVTRVEPSLEAVFVEYGSERQGFLPIREIANQYLNGNPREENIRKLIKEGDELIVQVEKEERGNKGAALSTYISLAGRYLVLMPNNPRGGGISRQISGKFRDDMKNILANLQLPKGMSVIIRTAGIGKSEEDLQQDLNHLLGIWQSIQDKYQNSPSPCLLYQEAGVVTRAVRDYLRDDIVEIWIDNENAYNEAASFINAVMPSQLSKLRKYTDYEPMFARFGIEKQIETAYQREVRLPSGGSIVIDQTEAMVSIDINSAKSTKGSDINETAYHTNLEAADEIARQLRLRDMGGLIVIDFIDMNDVKHRKDVEKRLIDACKYDRARVQFAEISKFGLMEMSRQRLRPSLEESTGYKCPRCNGNGMIRDLRSLSLSIMRQIEEIALKECQGEVQAEVPIDIAAFLLNEKRDSLVYLEQDSGTRITILPHSGLETPNFNLLFNRDGFAPSSYERITDTQQQEDNDRGYSIDWQTAESEQPDSTRHKINSQSKSSSSQSKATKLDNDTLQQPATSQQTEKTTSLNNANTQNNVKPQVIAWLSNLFAPTAQAKVAKHINSQDAAKAIEAIVNTGASSLGSIGTLNTSALDDEQLADSTQQQSKPKPNHHNIENNDKTQNDDNDKKRKPRKTKACKNRSRKEKTTENKDSQNDNHVQENIQQKTDNKRSPNSQRESRGAITRGETLILDEQQKHTKTQTALEHIEATQNNSAKESEKIRSEHTQKVDKIETDESTKNQSELTISVNKERHQKPNEVVLHINTSDEQLKSHEIIHLSLDNSKDNASDSKQQQTVNTQYIEPIPNVAIMDSTMEGDTVTHQITDDHPNEAIDELAYQNIQLESNQINLTHSKNNQQDDIFADTYITAHRFGKAKNDPRIVKAQWQKEQQNSSETKKSPTVIKGTVGEFIRYYLTDAETSIAQQGIIASFIQAINIWQQQSNVSKTDSSKTYPEFSFINYGYAPLDKNYLKQFNEQTQAVASFTIKQGKTAIEAQPISKRAINDPRGPYPNTIEMLEPKTNDNERTTTTSKKTSNKNEQNKVNLTETDLQQFEQGIYELLDLFGINQQELVSTNMDIQSEPQQPITIENSSQYQEQVNVQSVQTSADVDKNHIDDKSDELAEPSKLDANQVADKPKLSGKTSNTRKKQKTTVHDYKNMIESVAEQLLNQTNLFPITQPKPKSTKKPDKD